MAKVTPAQYAEKWGRRLRGAGEDIRRGIERVDKAPGVAAAASQELMLQKVTEAVNSGLWAKRVASVSLDDWKKSALEKGVPRIPAGVEAATEKMEKIAEELLPAVDAAAAAANALPKGTLEDSIARSAMFMREMAKRAPRKRGL